jgi:hypothetical protein
MAMLPVGATAVSLSVPEQPRREINISEANKRAHLFTVNLLK